MFEQDNYKIFKSYIRVTGAFIHVQQLIVIYVQTV